MAINDNIVTDIVDLGYSVVWYFTNADAYVELIDCTGNDGSLYLVYLSDNIDHNWHYNSIEEAYKAFSNIIKSYPDVKVN